MLDVLLNWEIGQNSGWGILGLNLFSQMVKDARVRPLAGHGIRGDHVTPIDPLRFAHILPAIVESNQFFETRINRDGLTLLDGVAIHGVGNDLRPHFLNVVGSVNVGRVIFEGVLPENARVLLEGYDALLTASNWNAALLRAATGREPKIVYEGVDTSVFCPGTRSGILNPDRFYVFSGGKVEFRKGQDLALLAFRAFSSRHPEAMLVTSWHSPWPHISQGFQGRLEFPLQLNEAGALDIKRWAADNGIDPDKVIDTPLFPNPLLPSLLRDVDVCLQPSRAEACTSLPVKEAMACGRPVIAAANTGMLDILRDENSIVLRHQRPVEIKDYPISHGWGESSVEEIVEALEWVYQNRSDAKNLGLRASEWIVREQRTWAAHTSQLVDWITTAGFSN